MSTKPKSFLEDDEEVIRNIQRIRKEKEDLLKSTTDGNQGFVNTNYHTPVKEEHNSSVYDEYCGYTDDMINSVMDYDNGDREPLPDFCLKYLCTLENLEKLYNRNVND